MERSQTRWWLAPKAWRAFFMVTLILTLCVSAGVTTGCGGAGAVLAAIGCIPCEIFVVAGIAVTWALSDHGDHHHPRHRTPPPNEPLPPDFRTICVRNMPVRQPGDGCPLDWIGLYDPSDIVYEPDPLNPGQQRIKLSLIYDAFSDETDSSNPEVQLIALDEASWPQGLDPVLTLRDGRQVQVVGSHIVCAKASVYRSDGLKHWLTGFGPTGIVFHFNNGDEIDASASPDLGGLGFQPVTDVASSFDVEWTQLGAHVYFP